MEHHDTYPLTLVSFFDGRDFDEGVMRYMSTQLLESFVNKKEKILLKGGDLRSLSHANSTKEFEATIPLLLENVLVEYVKSSFIELAAESLMIPWIYLCLNKEHAPQ